MTTAINGSTFSMPWCPKSANSTTMLWHRTVKRTTLEKPVSDSTAEFTAMPASSACTQLHPMRTTRFKSAGKVPPLIPNDARVRTIVGSPVRVPIQPTSARPPTPRSSPSRRIRTGRRHGPPAPHPHRPHPRARAYPAPERQGAPPGQRAEQDDQNRLQVRDARHEQRSGEKGRHYHVCREPDHDGVPEPHRSLRIRPGLYRVMAQSRGDPLQHKPLLSPPIVTA